MSEKWMWNGASGGITASAPARISSNVDVSVKPPSVTAWRWAKSDWADPARACRDREDVVRGPKLAYAAHDLDSERNGAVLLLQPLAQLAELFDHRVDRGVALTAEQETGVEDDDLRTGSLCDAGGMVEHPDSHVELLATLGMPHEACDRCVDGEDDARVARQFAELLGPRIVHPELALEVDLAGGVATFLEQCDGLLR
jgi:hypothetical protein